MSPNRTEYKSTLVQLMAWHSHSHQVITWPKFNHELCRRMTSPGHNKLNWKKKKKNPANSRFPTIS